MIGIVFGILSGLIPFIFPDLERPLEERSFNLPFMLLREDGKRDNPVIIKLDDASYTALNQNPYSFNGTNHANLIRRLTTEGVAAIVFDILFVDQNPNPPGDAEFAAAMKESGKVVLAGNLVAQREAGAPKKQPVPLRGDLEDAAAAIGLAKIAAEPGSFARAHYRDEGLFLPLPWKAAQVVGLPVTRIPGAEKRLRWLNFYGREPFPDFSYSDAVNPAFKFPVSLKGRTVFVGREEDAGYSGEEKDQFRYPWTALNRHMPFGVEIHALAFANLAGNDWLRRFPYWLELALLAAIGGGLGYFLPKLRPLAATVIAAGVVALVVLTGCILQLQANLWFDWLVPVLVQIPLVLGWAILFHSVRSYFEAEFLNRSLALYLSPAQVQDILRRPELLKPGVEQREVSILFSDIANFSKICERMLPEDIAQLLNAYYEATIACVHETGGTVMNLIGDAILAIWNAPQAQPDHRERACRAATALARKLVEFDANQQNLQLRTRIGLHTGIVSVGNIGSSSHFDYAVIGENVNLASRLEGLNKYLETTILATRQIQKPVEQQLSNRFVGHFKFKGFDQVAGIYEFFASEAPSESSWQKDFAEGLHCFQRAAFAEAREKFNAVLKAKPGDGPSKFYLQKIEEYSAAPPKSGWMGEIDLDSK